MTALQAELQATKGLIQAGSYGCAGETASPIPYGFLESVRHRFWPCKYEDPQGAFSELLHKGKVAQYQEAYLGDQEVSLVSNTTIVNSGGRQSQKDNPELVKPTLSVAQPKPTSNSDEDADADQVKLEDVALESGDIFTLNSLVGNGSPQTLQLCGTIGLGNTHVLIDIESTHNFVQPGVVERMKLAVSITKPFKVYIRGGETLLYENICSKVGINMQEIAMEVDLYVLMMNEMLRRQQQQQIATHAKIQRRLRDPDQVAARKQQFGAFQEDIAALRAELQATKGLIQAGSYGCGDPQGAFSELLHKGTVAQYQEACLGDQQVSLVSNTTIVNSGRGQNQKDNLKLVKPTLSAAPPKPISNSDEDADADQVKLEDVALESGDISTLISLVGNESPRTLQLCGTIGLGNTHVLIDNESTHNFVQPGVVERMKLAVSITKPFKVYIESGVTLLYENICSKMGLNMQGIVMEVDLYVLMMNGMLRRQQQPQIAMNAKIQRRLWDPGIKIFF
nr:hypothetical protein [Tanacetum cinerariifolium]